MSASAKIPAKFFHAIPFHRQGITGKNVTVAVLDSGLAPHPDIHPSRILAFKDFTREGAPSVPYYDDFSHGTHVTGIIASEKIGIAPECSIVALKVLDRRGNGSSDFFINALKWLLKHQKTYNIQIVNISAGGSSTQLKNSSLNLWVSALWNQGMTVCCSAGNNGPSPNSITAPGNCKKVITVGSSDGANYSSAGPLLPSGRKTAWGMNKYSTLYTPDDYITKPELAAPGTHILSLKPGSGYHIKSGTSMSVPFISGACALLCQVNPLLTNDQTKIRLMNAAAPVPHLPVNVQGAGVVSLERLLHTPYAPKDSALPAVQYFP